jgi:peroxiredoxin
MPTWLNTNYICTSKNADMKQFLLLGLSFLSFTSCQQGDAKGKDKSTVDSTAVVAVAEKENASVKWGDIGMITGPVTVEGKFLSPVFNGKLIFLYETEGKESYVVDSVKVANNAFKFGPDERMVGVYKIGLDPNNVVEVILNPQESLVKIDFRNVGRLEASATFPESKENQIWQEYIRTEKQFQNDLTNLKRQRGQSPNKEQFEAQIYAKDDERVASHFALGESNKGTFAAKLLHRMRSPEHKNKSKYWDDIDFTDLSYIHSIVLTDRIQDFMRNHSGGTEDGFLTCVDILMARAKADEKMFEYVLYTVLEGFYASGMDSVCNYILNDYYFGDACGEIELSELSKVKASRIKNLQLGNTPPDFTMTSTKGQKINLKAEAGKNKYTLVFFWSSWCHTCENEIPTLQTIYAESKAKGFDIIGVSVDTEETAWKNAVNSRNLPWAQVSQLKGWKSPVAVDYRVTKTPGMFLIDQQMKIVAKPKTANEVKAFLQKNL